MKHNTVFMVALFGAEVAKIAAAFCGGFAGLYGIAALYGTLESSPETAGIAITAAALAVAGLIVGTAAKVVTAAVEAAE